jgi:hypothetical protein
VRIEWTENGRWRSRTVGPNSAATRRRADHNLEDILGRLRSAGESPPDQEHPPTPRFGRTLREQAASILDVADILADWIREAIGVGTKTE